MIELLGHKRSFMKSVFLIINYNDVETTMSLIENIKGYACLDLIVVLDNMSTDDSYRILKKYCCSHIHVIQSEANKGYAYAMNYGCKYLINLFGDCNIIVSNADIVINREEDILRLIHTKTDEMAILAPVIREHDGVSRGWKIPTPFQDSLLNLVYVHRFLKPKLLYYPDEYYQNKELVEVECILGCFFMIDSRYLEKAGFFDENTFLYYEENIMAKKLKDIQAKTMICCEVQVFHNHSVSIDKSVSRLNKYVALKTSQYYFQKHYNHANVFECFLLRFTYWFSYGIFKIIYSLKG